MKVLLLKDVYKLGRAGDLKRVANGYGRNYLIPQGLAVLATSGALTKAEMIRTEANKERSILNKELSGVAEKLQGMLLTFPARASETGRLYGSINTRMIADTISEKIGVEIGYRQIDSQPLRMIGEHTVAIRLTIDLVPEISVIVHREGETVAAALEEAEMRAEFGADEELEEPVYADEIEETSPEEVEAGSLFETKPWDEPGEETASEEEA